MKSNQVNPEIKERIINTANTLVAEGMENPTNDQVRERMGGGSLSHISPVMREWRESRKAEVVAALEMPADLKKVIEGSLGQVWTVASKLASATVETVRQEADEAITNVTAERDEALAEIQRLESRLAELEKALNENDKTIGTLKNEVETIRADSATLRSENATLVARINDKDQQLSALKDELKESREDNKALQGELLGIAKKVTKNE